MNPPHSNELRPLPRLVYALAAVPAGLVFLIAGAAKLTDSSSLAGTIQTITGAPGGIAALLALLLIGAEIAGGLLLILAIRPRIAATGLAALVAAFLLFPLLPGVADVPDRCTCFGPLTPELSSKARTALDLCLLALLALIALAGHPRAGRWSWILPVTLTFAAIPQALPLSSPPHELTRALAHAATVDPIFARKAGNRALLILDVSDFLCPPCYQDIRLTVDTLSRLEAASPRHRAVVLFRSRGRTAEQSEARARRWRMATRTLLVASAIADSLLDSDGRGESTAAVINEDGEVIFRETFPLGERSRQRLLRLLNPPRGGES